MLGAIFGKGVFDQDAGVDAPDMKSEVQKEASRKGIDVQLAIDSHIKWRRKLEDIILGGVSESLRVEEVSSDNHCELGQWIHGEGHQHYGHLDVFKELRTAHAHLHERAGTVVGDAKQGRHEEALANLQTVEYSRAIARLKNLLAKIYVEVLSSERIGNQQAQQGAS